MFDPRAVAEQRAPGASRTWIDGENRDGPLALAQLARECGEQCRLARAGRPREANQMEASSAAGSPGPASLQRAATAPDADRDAIALSIAETLEAALGADVKVRRDAAGGYAAQLHFQSQDEALALAQRLRPRSVA